MKKDTIPICVILPVIDGSGQKLLDAPSGLFHVCVMKDREKGRNGKILQLCCTPVSLIARHRVAEFSFSVSTLLSRV
ncbi:hypothetical protein SAMD00023353_0601880 [Rosellinia necatrix]|uniref:Uncharacterized protein n=1 Tax=Rosellinia necatrix TaxID=77044 RepID=A0A1S8A5Q6_ROSNE|nr:hypothetical protein SAMD00023353_0601880 [Rosellinia necatrix]